MMYIKQSFLRMKSIIPETAPSTTASVANDTLLTYDSATYSIGSNFLCTLVATTGNIWINPLGTATTNSFKLAEGDSINLQVPGEGVLSLISDTTTAKIQAIIWE